MKQKNRVSQSIGHAIAEYAAPGLSKALSVFGTAAMLTVGGGILMHDIAELLPSAGNLIHTAEHLVHSIPLGQSFLLPTAMGAVGGAIAIPAAKYGIIPAYNKVVKPCVDLFKKGLSKIKPGTKKKESQNNQDIIGPMQANEKTGLENKNKTKTEFNPEVDKTGIKTDVMLNEDLNNAAANQNKVPKEQKPLIDINKNRKPEVK
jgi:hypothetical protein